MYPCGRMDGVMIALGGRHGDRGCSITTPRTNSALAHMSACARVPDWCPTLCTFAQTRTHPHVLRGANSHFPQRFLYLRGVPQPVSAVVKSGVSFNYGEQV
jgi:hypothetical protein